MIRVGGMTPLTSIDFPGRLAAVLYLQGCPWRCGYCHNPELLPARGQGGVAWAQAEAFLHRRVGLLDAVVFSGGEPTSQAALPIAFTCASCCRSWTGSGWTSRRPTRITTR